MQNIRKWKCYYTKSLEKVLENTGHRKLIMYGNDLLTEIIYWNLREMGRDIAYFVMDTGETEFCGKEVKNVSELLREDKEQIYILVFVIKDHREYYQKLMELGFVFEQEFCVYGAGGYLAKFDVVDSLLGFSRKYQGVPGFEIYGDSNNKKALRIIALGNSTSDPTAGNYTSWPKQLYEKIRQEQEVVVYSGGMGGYGIHQEFLKFLRDGLVINPDIVITFGGYTDAEFQVCCEDYPFLHRYQRKFYDMVEQNRPMAPDTLDMRGISEITHGLARTEYSDVENYISGVRKIHAIASEFGIQYFGVFQPMLLSGKAIIDESIQKLKQEILIAYPRIGEVYERIPEYVKECQKEIKLLPYMTDLTYIFDNQEDVYYDVCHATDKGNQIIMEHIYDKIKHVFKT